MLVPLFKKAFYCLNRAHSIRIGKAGKYAKNNKGFYYNPSFGFSITIAG